MIFASGKSINYLRLSVWGTFMLKLNRNSFTFGLAALFVVVNVSSASSGPVEFYAAMEARCLSRSSEGEYLQDILKELNKDLGEYCQCEAAAMTSALMQDMNQDMNQLAFAAHVFCTTSE